LDLGNNGITDRGANALSTLLHAKRSLKELNLYMNDIGDHGVSKVCCVRLQASSLVCCAVGCACGGKDRDAATQGCHFMLLSLESVGTRQRSCIVKRVVTTELLLSKSCIVKLLS
jgi:hypothetical protein